MNEAGLALEENPRDAEQLRHVRRAVHTLKGDSAACGFRQLSELAHELEDVLTPEVAEKNAGTIAEVVLTAADTFHEMLAAYRNNLQPPAGDALRERIARLLDTSAAPKAQDPATQAKFEWNEYERLMIAEAFGRGESVYNVALYIDPETPLPAAAFELIRKALEGAGKILAIRPEKGAATEQDRLMEAALSTEKSADWIRKRCPCLRSSEIFRRAHCRAAARPARPARHSPRIGSRAVSAGIKPGRADAASPAEDEPHDPARRPACARPAENTLRVDAARIDTVMNLVGELIIGKSMLQRAIAEFERRHVKDPLRAKFSDALAFQSRVLGELQKSVMKIRMVPVEQLFRRFPRIVRDVARLRNKDIGIEIAGQNTDLDKGILDALAEPLAHLVRNAADHGIETADERQAAGKPPRGTIRLNAYHEGDQVVIEVSDDGRGLDRDKIVRRAIESGIISTEERFA